MVSKQNGKQETRNRRNKKETGNRKHKRKQKARNKKQIEITKPHGRPQSPVTAHPVPGPWSIHGLQQSDLALTSPRSSSQTPRGGGVSNSFRATDLCRSCHVALICRSAMEASVSSHGSPRAWALVYPFLACSWCWALLTDSRWYLSRSSCKRRTSSRRLALWVASVSSHSVHHGQAWFICLWSANRLFWACRGPGCEARGHCRRWLAQSRVTGEPGPGITAFA